MYEFQDIFILQEPASNNNKRKKKELAKSVHPLTRDAVTKGTRDSLLYIEIMKHLVWRQFTHGLAFDVGTKRVHSYEYRDFDCSEKPSDFLYQM